MDIDIRSLRLLSVRSSGEHDIFREGTVALELPWQPASPVPGFPSSPVVLFYFLLCDKDHDQKHLEDKVCLAFMS